MFSRRSATVFMFMRCFTPMFSLTELPPHEPQPSVSEGASSKLYTSPMAPCDEGMLMRVRPVVSTSWKWTMRSRLASSVYSTEVCPAPPSSTRRWAMSTAVAKSGAR